MKKLLVVLLSLGLIAAFGMTASAADVKFAGQYYVVGVYENNRTLQDTDHTYSQRLLLDPDEGADGLPGRRRALLHDPLRRLRKAVGRREPQQQQHRRQVQLREGQQRQRDAPGKHRDGARLCDLQDDGRPVRHRLSGRRRVGNRLRRHPGLPSAGEVHRDLRSRHHHRHLREGLRGGHRQIERDDEPAYCPRGLVDGDADNYMLAGIYNWKGGAAGLLYKCTPTRRSAPAHRQLPDARSSPRCPT